MGKHVAKSAIDWDQVGPRLRALRASADLTQLEVATRAGLQPGQVSRHEGGQARFDLDTAAKYAECYGVPIDYIVYGIEPAREKSGATIRPPAAVLDYVQRFGPFIEPEDREALLGMRWPVTPDEPVVRSVHAVLMDRRRDRAASGNDPGSGSGPSR